MEFFRHNWYKIGLGVGILTAVILPFFWNDMGVVQRLLFLNFIAMTIHQFEEFGFPGGVPYLMNVRWSQSNTPDRYPQNANAVMVGNVITTYIFYLLPAFLPEHIWFGLGGIIIGLTQITAHSKLSVTLRHIYAPGNFAAFVGHIPIGIYFIYYAVGEGLLTPMDWVLGFAITAFVGVVIVYWLGYKFLADEHSPYPFSQEEMERKWILERLKTLDERAKS